MNLNTVTVPATVTASFHSKADDPGFFVFYYKDIGQYLTHDLHLDEHGITKSWVIISKN